MSDALRAMLQALDARVSMLTAGVGALFKRSDKSQDDAEGLERRVSDLEHHDGSET